MEYLAAAAVAVNAAALANAGVCGAGKRQRHFRVGVRSWWSFAAAPLRSFPIGFCVGTQFAGHVSRWISDDVYSVRSRSSRADERCREAVC